MAAPVQNVQPVAVVQPQIQPVVQTPPPKGPGSKEAKDSKKAPKQEPVVVQPVVEEEAPQNVAPFELNFEHTDPTKVKLHISIQTLENCPGLALDAATYPEAADNPQAFQSSFWVEFNLNGR